MGIIDLYGCHVPSTSDEPQAHSSSVGISEVRGCQVRHTFEHLLWFHSHLFALGILEMHGCQVLGTSDDH